MRKRYFPYFLFFGSGIALRNNVQLAFDFPAIFWKHLTRSTPIFEDLKEIDFKFTSDVALLYQLLDAGSIKAAMETFEQLWPHESFVCTLCDCNTTVELVKGGKQV